jgi:hypothetical protein
VKWTLIFGIVLLLIGFSMTGILFLGARLGENTGIPDNRSDVNTNENFTTGLCFTDIGLFIIFLQFFTNMWVRFKSKGGEQSRTKSKTNRMIKKVSKLDDERWQ